MTFDVSELPGRAQELLTAYHDAMMQMMAAAGAYGYVPPTDDATSATILTIYDDFLSIPDPDRFGWITDDLLTAMQVVAADGTSSSNTGDASITFANKDLDGLKTSGDELENWTGVAAKRFKSDYADVFPSMVHAHYSSYLILRHAVAAEAAVWKTVRDDLDKLSNDAIHAMRHVNDCHPDWKVILEVAGAVAAIALALPSGGTSLAVDAAATATVEGVTLTAEASAAIAGGGYNAWNAVTAGVTVASTGMDVVGAGGGQTDQYGVDCGSPEQIISSLGSVLGKIKSYITSQEAKIVSDLLGLLSDIDGHQDVFLLPVPDLSNATRAHVTAEMGHPY
jgi:hypothetical protein